MSYSPLGKRRTEFFLALHGLVGRCQTNGAHSAPYKQTVMGAITPKSQHIPAGDFIPPEVVDLQGEHGFS